MEAQLGVSYTLTIKPNEYISKTNLLRRIKKSESALISVPELELDVQFTSIIITSTGTRRKRQR